ncbi:MFS-type transporter SLC18B1-like isoform X2 [Tachypleus tridentatus]|uniref:MFS-type transporter SLC18B1-like isoform X2 n=1 Tax=Tachypleus tridentatus TaxID=6853 RepID=UPI003FD62325
MPSFPMSTTYETVSELSKSFSSSSETEKIKTIPSATCENIPNLLESNTSQRNVQTTDLLKLYSYTNYENSESLYDPDDQSYSSPLISHDLENKNKSCITKRQALILFQINFAFTCQASCYALVFSFFSKEAERKQMTTTQYGFLYGVFSLTTFLLSPVIFKIIPKISPKCLLISGICLGGGATIFIGTLIKSPSDVTFLTLSFVGRIVQAIGSASLFTLGYVFIANEITEYRSTALASSEMFYGFGVTIGPAVGGALYEVGGYMLPFFLIGGIHLCLSAIMFFLLPETEYATQDNKGEVLKIILNPSFIVAMINILTGFIIVGFNEATLEPHIRQPDSFLPLYITNSVSIMSLLLIGPAPFLPLKITFWLVIFAQVLLGIGTGGKVIIGFNYALRSTISRGFPNNVTTLTIVSGLFNSAASFGCFIGPSLGGALLEQMGYENGTMVLLGFELTVMAITVLHVLWKKLVRVLKETQEL